MAQSEIIVSDEWKMFEEKSRYGGFSRADVTRILPLQTLTPLGSGDPITLVMSDTNSFMDMPKGQININMKIANQSDPNTPLGTQDYALRNGAPLFSSAQLFANNTLVENKSDLDYCNYFSHHIRYSKTFSDNAAQPSHWYLDDGACGTDRQEYTLMGTVTDIGGTGPRYVSLGTGGANDNRNLQTEGANITPMSLVSSDTYNSGYAKRRKIASSSKTFTVSFMLRELFDYFRDVEKITQGIEYRIVLHRCPSYTRSIQGVQTDPVYNPAPYYHSMELLVPRYEPSAFLKARLYKDLNGSKSARHTFEVMDALACPPVTATTGIIPPIQHQLSQARRPTKVYLVFFNTDAINGAALTAAAWKFYNMGITNVSLTVNGTQITSLPMATNFTNTDSTSGQADWNRLYEAYCEIVSKSVVNDNGEIAAPMHSYEEFGRNYAIWCFDLMKVDDSLFTANTTVNFQVTAPANPNGFSIIPYVFYQYLQTVEFSTNNGRVDVKLV